MQTVILRPMRMNAEGVVEYYIKDGRLTVKYNLNLNDTEKVMRLAAFSSRKPSNMPLKIDVPVFEGSMSSGKRVITAKEAAYCGYRLEDIDTFALIFCDRSDTKIASAGFASLCWDISYQVSRNCENNTDEPVKKAEKLLLKIKKHPASDEEYQNVLKYISHEFSKLTKSNVCPCEGYEWYNYGYRDDLFGLSALRHLICTDEFINAYKNSRLCLAGIKDNNRIALAVKTKNSNPFVTAEDCAVQRNGFCIVGILLKKDGQYFERIE